MPDVIRKITLTSDPGSAGPLYDVFYSTDCVNYTICIDGSGVSLPSVGSTVNVTVPDNTTCIRLVNLSAGCGNNSVTESLLFVEYLVVAGGGAGGSKRHDGGGGAGGLQSGSFRGSLSTPYSVTIGAGGAFTATRGNNGSNSIFNVITSTGGGGGGGGADITSANMSGSNGGSGGGGGSAFTPNSNNGRGTAGQGNNGGIGFANVPYAGGGGGGASQAGQNASTNGGGNGGSGSVWNGTFYAGGGGGSWYEDNPPIPTLYVTGSGGVGGGGNSGGRLSPAAQPGTTNTGGGGGGANGATLPNNGGDGGNGGSGIVRLRYPSTFTAIIGSGLTGTTLTTGSFKITTITAGTGTMTFV